MDERINKKEKVNLWSKDSQIKSKISETEATLFRLQQLVSEGHLSLCPNQLLYLRECIRRLDYIKGLLETKRFVNFLVYEEIWLNLHRLDEDLLLLLPREELSGRALKILNDFSINIVEKSLRELWLEGSSQGFGLLVEALKKLESSEGNLEPLEEKRVRHTLRTSLRIINERTDDRFWRLLRSTLLNLGVASVLLIILIVVPLLLSMQKIISSFSILSFHNFMLVVLFGLTGAYTSYFFGKHKYIFVRGASITFFLFYIFAKPLFSAWVALFITILAKSGLIFVITTSETVTTSQFIFKVEPEREFYAYLILAFISGFSAEKVMERVLDRLLNRFHQEAEKTIETKAE